MMLYTKLSPVYERVLAIVAHPDDAEIWAGGVLALAPFSAVLVLSRGAGGGDPLVRTREQHAAAEVLGLDLIDIRYEPDGFMIDSARLRGVILDTIHIVRPQLVLTHAPWDRHGDHRAVASAVMAMVNIADKPRLAEDTSCPDPVLWYFHSEIPMPTPLIEQIVDIEQVLTVKTAAINCHTSQRVSYAPDYPAQQAAEWAEGTQFTYAERFYHSPYGADGNVKQRWQWMPSS